MMNAAIGWILAALAIALGYWQWGWPGAVLGITLVVFWLLLQFSRALRVLRRASQAPMGHIDNAVTLYAKLHAGQRLPQILKLTRSLGIKLSDNPETFEWRDTAGDAVWLEFAAGQLARWQLQRADPVRADA
jgi:Co/Zn/Cd efflux system component